MHGNVVGLAAFDFVLRIFRGGMMGISFVIEILYVNFHNRSGYMAGLRIPGDMVACFKFMSHRWFLMTYFCTCKPCEIMHETYREYLEHGSLRFLIIVFNEDKKYLLKIFLHRVAVYQFPIDAPNEDATRLSEEPMASFEKHIKTAREWVLSNY